MSEKRSANLCSIYILPMLGLNRHSFEKPERFINSYMNKDDKHVVVVCTHPFSNVIINHPNFKFQLQKDDKYLAVFEIPKYYQSDAIKWREGKYSLLSEAAKNLIRKKSGLSYKVPNKGKPGYTSAIELLALDKDKSLKTYWEEKIGVKLPENAELQSIPGDDNFYDLNLTNTLELTV